MSDENLFYSQLIVTISKLQTPGVRIIKNNLQIDVYKIYLRNRSIPRHRTKFYLAEVHICNSGNSQSSSALKGRRTTVDISPYYTLLMPLIIKFYCRNEPLLNWFDDYLCNRVQYVKYKTLSLKILISFLQFHRVHIWVYS